MNKGSGCLCGGSFGASEALRSSDVEKSRAIKFESDGAEVSVTSVEQAESEGQT